MENLDEVIVLNRVALDLRPLGHPDWSMSLTNLAIYLSTRYKELGAIKDLHWEALNLRPSGHPPRSISLTNLANRLSTWYD